ncbi:uncharacterized protein LOC113279516 [Papaver somniferum]|uniref:uncharacterized protein LOC113279516 n=1 Tax=Papaver somniferum TaxID=3469 RepID=UPI000E70228F|nr:uncharacterized protein LOC113279516 [Papaver somniferum]
MSAKPHNRISAKNRDFNDTDDDDMPQCFKCKGFGHLAHECQNRRKYTGNKSLATTLDENSDHYDSQEEEISSVSLLGEIVNVDNCSNTHINLDSLIDDYSSKSLENQGSNRHPDPQSSGTPQPPPNGGFDDLNQLIRNFRHPSSSKFTRTPKVDFLDSMATFVQDLYARFEDVAHDNYVGSFNKLSQTSTVEDYYDKWEHYKSYMVANNPSLPESFYTLSFISGLKEEIHTVVQMFKPADTSTTFYLAGLQQASLHPPPKSVKPFFRPFTPTPLSVSHPPSTIKPFFSSTSTFSKGTGSSPPPIVTHLLTLTKHSPDPTFPLVKLLTLAQMQNRKDKGLCYNCDEFYRHGHKCKTQQLFMLIADDELDEQGALSNDDVSDASHSGSESPIEISLHALTGTTTHETIRIDGHINKHLVAVLIDTRSTHSILDATLISKLGLHVTPTGQMLVTVANGESIISQGICHNLSWEMQGYQFSVNLLALPLGGCEIVLGADWLRQLGDVLFNFALLRISFLHQGRKITLQGTHSKPSLSLISGSSLVKFLKQNTPTIIGQFFSISSTPIIPPPPAVSTLLDTFADVFAEPTGLPPSRPLDHKIPLKTGSNPTYQRPYKCPYIHKSVVESLVSEMLSNGVIQKNHSPFVAHILLLKKKDDTWRFCVDYRKLNDIMVKDKFPIPLIEELLDELNGSVVFSKIDWRSGYYQIRLYALDIYKTAFRTHHGHFEFRVMPFGLTNAPATFQALMNEVFQPYLRKFVLVFFVDILVYIPSMEAHLEHLQLTLSLLRKHSLFAKMSKCAFAQPQLEYHGHIFSASGVAADPEKIESMVNWPKTQTLK